MLEILVLLERPAERFAYLERLGAELMIQEAAGPGRRFRRALLEAPYRRGVNVRRRSDIGPQQGQSPDEPYGDMARRDGLAQREKHPACPTATPRDSYLHARRSPAVEDTARSVMTVLSGQSGSHVLYSAAVIPPRPEHSALPRAI